MCTYDDFVGVQLKMANLLVLLPKYSKYISTQVKTKLWIKNTVSVNQIHFSLCASESVTWKTWRTGFWGGPDSGRTRIETKRREI